jgi:hypothetical protein
MASWPGQRRETTSTLLSQHAKPHVKQHVTKQSNAKAMSKQCTVKTCSRDDHAYAIYLSHDFHICIPFMLILGGAPGNKQYLYDFHALPNFEACSSTESVATQVRKLPSKTCWLWTAVVRW